MKCDRRLEDDYCQLSFPLMRACVGEDNCTSYQMNANRLCPSCNCRGANWSGYGEHGGFNYTCWSCGHTWVEELIWPSTPGICKRCGRTFNNPIPEVTQPEGNYEIACDEWCADCNALTMNVVFRDSSAYKTRKLYDPMKMNGGRQDAG